MIKVNSQFIDDTIRREPYRDPLNHIGCGVIAELSVQLMLGRRARARNMARHRTAIATDRTSTGEME